jgi:GMP synthase-like glutamine amidotransferase
MQIHVCQHVPFEGPGAIGDWIARRFGSPSTTCLWRNEPLPEPASVDGLVVMGGPMGVDQQDQHPWLAGETRFIQAVVSAGKPVIGVCLGAQLIARALGARVFPNGQKEIGWFPVRRRLGAESSAFGRLLPVEMPVLHWHGDTFDLPHGATALAASEACVNQAFAVGDRVLALQFHLEVTPEGLARLIDNCRDELVEAPFIQKPEEMLGDAGRFEQAHGLLDPLLHHLFAGD